MLQDIHKKVYFHIGAWAGFLLIILFSADGLDRVFFFKSLSNVIPAIFLFYILILWVFPKFLGNHINIKTAIITLFLSMAAVFLRPFFLLIVPDLYWPFDRITFWVQFRYNILFVGVAFAYHYASEIIKSEQSRSLLEKEMVDAKLALLKNQLNPHFLYNALSLLYSKTLPLSDEVATLVGKISEILRYSLDEPLDENGMVPITKEIAHIQNYIDIQSQRFSNKLKVDFEVIDDVSAVKIAPMLLITFVENSFKHGDWAAPISFKLNVENGIEFTTENKIGQANKDASSGIGLENIRKRLELVYPKRHTLQISEAKNTYFVYLKIVP